MEELLEEIRNSKLCEDVLPLGPKPILAASETSKIVIISQAPGLKAHQTGIPFNDPSGIRLREWMGIDDDIFYDAKRIAIIPMGFSYPGRGKSGDLPPCKKCAPHWHPKLFKLMDKIELKLLVGQYAQKYYLGKRMKRNLTETVRTFDDYLPEYLPMPHPSPRNNIWLKKNPWFEEDFLPVLKHKIKTILDL